MRPPVEHCPLTAAAAALRSSCLLYLLLLQPLAGCYCCILLVLHPAVATCCGCYLLLLLLLAAAAAASCCFFFVQPKMSFKELSTTHLRNLWILSQASSCVEIAASLRPVHVRRGSVLHPTKENTGGLWAVDSLSAEWAADPASSSIKKIQKAL